MAHLERGPATINFEAIAFTLRFIHKYNFTYILYNLEHEEKKNTFRKKIQTNGFGVEIYCVASLN